MSQSVQVGFKAQSGLGVAATGTVPYILHTRMTETPGRITDQGEIEIGAPFATFGANAVYGMQPVMTGAGRARVPSIGPLLELAGRANAAGVYTPVTTAALYPYYTALINYGVHKKALIDCKIRRLVISVVPRRAPTFEYTLVGLNHITSALALAAVAGEKVLTPAEAITSGESTIAGVAGTNFYSFQYIIENTQLTDRVPVGRMAADDNFSAAVSTRCVLLLANTAANYEKFMYGAAAATAPTAALQTGALHVKINAPNGGAAPTQWLDLAWATAEWQAAREITVTPTGMELIEVTGYALTGVVETIV